MSHELDKLDSFLGIPQGTSRKVIVSHCDPAVINERIGKYGIILDGFGMVPSSQKPAWKELMEKAGVDKQYWKTKEATAPQPIELVEL